MATLKFYIRAGKKAKTAQIRARFRAGRQIDCHAKTDKVINPEYWNNAKGTVRHKAGLLDSDSLASDLDKLKFHILTEYNVNGKKQTIDSNWLQTTIDVYYNPGKAAKALTLFNFINDFIENSPNKTNTATGQPIAYRTVRKYHNTFNYLKQYAKKYGEPDFIDIDLEFYQNFTAFLRDKTLSTNTIGKFIATLKVFLNRATERGVNKYLKYKSRNFTVLKESVENIYLNKNEIYQLYEYDFSDMPYLERIRDKFVIGCFTGLRYSDWHKITLDSIENQMIVVKQQKTGGKVIIPLHPIVLEILNKYSGENLKPISNQKANDYLKVAAKLAGIDTMFKKRIKANGMRVEKNVPKYEIISTHTARRSFCTNAYKDNIPTLSIMAISGHKSEKDFLKYIKADATEHAEKVLQVWQNSGEFLRKAK